MIMNSTADIYTNGNLWDDTALWDDTQVRSDVGTVNTEGQVIIKYTYLKTINCDVQPATLTESQLQIFGLTNLKSDVKKMFFEDKDVMVFMRAVVEGVIYEIRQLNRWTSHNIALLLPVQGV